MKKTPIYLDYAAATPLDREVFRSMEPYFAEFFYNPSASYLGAKKVRQAVESARVQIAFWFGAKPAEIIFTAGATEANNLVLRGIMDRYEGANLIVSAIEHDAILAPARAYAHAIAPVDKTGRIDLQKLRSLIDERTILVSVDYANNEIGTIQPLRQIAALLAEVRKERQKSGNVLPIYLHSDASQVTPYLDLHVSRLGVDLMTINGSKVYGPKQVGVLFVNAHIELQPQILGGGQEHGLRSGTENVAGIIGMATALQRAQEARREASTTQALLRDMLQAQLAQHYPHLVINGDQKNRLPNNLNVSWPGLDGERLLMLCDELGLQVATGAACSANKGQGSHVLRAIGLDEATIDGSIRMTLGKHTTKDDIEETFTIIQKAVGSL